MQKDIQGKPLYFYVANLGSEIQRIFAWKEKNDNSAMKNAYYRANSLIEKIKNIASKNANVEICILQDLLKKFVIDGEQILNRDQISNFFNPFALRITDKLFND